MAEDGHLVYVLSSIDDYSEYYNRLGIIKLSMNSLDIKSWVKENDPDYILLTHLFTGYRLRDLYPNKCIGLDDFSREFEVKKFETNLNVERLGVRVPEKINEIEVPCVIKPKDITHNIDMTQIYLSEESKPFIKGNFYYERYIPDNIESNVAFVISHGKWSIMHTQEVIGEDLAKMAGNFIHWTATSSFRKLSEANNKLTIDNATKILDWMVEVSPNSSFVGQITGLIKDGEWYFCEINVRPEQTNSLPYFISGDDWLKSMQGEPDIIGDAFPKDVQKIIVMPKKEDSPYPFHLHKKYDVAIPSGLEIYDNQYQVIRSLRTRARDRRIGLVICDRIIPQEFIDEIEKDGNFFVSG